MLSAGCLPWGYLFSLYLFGHEVLYVDGFVGHQKKFDCCYCLWSDFCFIVGVFWSVSGNFYICGWFIVFSLYQGNFVWSCSNLKNKWSQNPWLFYSNMLMLLVSPKRQYIGFRVSFWLLLTLGIVWFQQTNEYHVFCCSLIVGPFCWTFLLVIYVVCLFIVGWFLRVWCNTF